MLWFYQRGAEGTYPGTRVAAALCAVDRSTASRAEQDLEILKYLNGRRTSMAQDVTASWDSENQTPASKVRGPEALAAPGFQPRTHAFP